MTKKETFMGFLCITLFLLFVGLLGGWESKYHLNAFCVNWDSEQNTYYFEDSRGEIWAWDAENNEHFEYGHLYRLVMDDNHTTSIYDDWIYKIKEN